MVREKNPGRKMKKPLHTTYTLFQFKYIRVVVDFAVFVNSFSYALSIKELQLKSPVDNSDDSF